MKNSLMGMMVGLGLTIVAGGCGGYNGEKVAQQREEWHEALADSITKEQSQRKADSLKIEQLRELIADELPNFINVDNPREVEPYYILASFKNSYPLGSTGIAARMLKNEQLELIAALSGKPFDAIRVEAGAQSVTSNVVPYDQALNYRANGLTTVAFSGASADSIAALISDAGANDVTLQYLQGGIPQSSIKLTASQHEWVSATWRVCSAQKECHLLEQRMLTSGRKIQILEITLKEEQDKANEK